MSYFDKCEECGMEFSERSYDWAWCDKCLDNIECPRCDNNLTKEWVKLCLDTDCCKDCTKIIDHKCDKCLMTDRCFDCTKNHIFTLSDSMGFEYMCKEHRLLCNDDDYMRIHLHMEHDIRFPLKYWQRCCTTFSVGDSYSVDYRCNFCKAEFMFEEEAKKHILGHGIILEDV